MTSTTKPDRWQLVAGWFLVVSYVVGAPAFAIVEARTGLFSAKFGYPPIFLYLVSAAQVVCASTLFLRALAPWSAAVLTAITVGAVVSHLRIDSATAAIPAVAYTAIQAWYGLRAYEQRQDASG